MRSKERIQKFLDEIKVLWEDESFVDWRFGQLISNFLGWLYHTRQRDVFFLEEDQFLTYLKEYMEEIRNGENYF